MMQANFAPSSILDEAMRRTDQRSHCPVNYALEVVGDPWTLLVVRDIVFHGKHTFGEFMASEERVTTSVLADRLTRLADAGVIRKAPCPSDHRRFTYALTEKGLELIPILVELANWGVAHDPEVITNPLWVEKAAVDPAGLAQLIRETVEAGGSVFRGEDSVIDRLAAARAQPSSRSALATSA